MTWVRWPRKFVAPANGMIIPNHALGGDSAQYTINVGHGVTATEFEMNYSRHSTRTTKKSCRREPWLL